MLVSPPMGGVQKKRRNAPPPRKPYVDLDFRFDETVIGWLFHPKRTACYVIFMLKTTLMLYTVKVLEVFYC